VARRLRAEGRWMGRARLPGRLGEIAREIEGKARIHGRRSESPYLLPETVVQEHVFLLDRGGVRL